MPQEPVETRVTVDCEVIRYNDADCSHAQHLTHEAALALCANNPDGTVLWVNVERVADADVVRAVARHFNMHPLLVEDVLHTSQRPKIETYDGQIYVVARMLAYEETADTVSVEQVSFVLGMGWLVLFQENPGDVFNPVRSRIKSAGSRIRAHGADWLLYALLDALVDSYFTVLERVGERIEAIEEDLIENQKSTALATLHDVRKQLMVLRRTIWPLRDAVNALQHDTSQQIAAETAVYLRDVYDHTVRLIDTVETYRDTLASVYDLYMSSVSNRMNNIMKVLTIISTIFIPLSFVTGIFGMNFRYMPELEKTWGYPAALAAMLLIAGAMLLFFRRKDWI